MKPPFASWSCLLPFVVGIGLIVLPLTSRGGQTDIPGPAGSGAFGSSVTVLPNGNFVVTDPQFDLPGKTDVGAVYLYSPTGTLISTLTGNTAGDMVGFGGVKVLSNGNFLVVSWTWSNGGASGAGAVTWGSAST